MQLLYAFILYLSYLSIWGIICLLAYLLSLIFKKKSIMEWVMGITSFISWILNAILGIWLLIYTFGLLSNGNYFWFILMIFFGIGVVSQLASIIQMPFYLIPSYFSVKLNDMNLDENITPVEILDENNKVVDISEGEVTIKQNLAKYFILLYSSCLFLMLLFPSGREGMLIGDYLLNPLLQVGTVTVLVGVIYSIYYRLRYGTFFPIDKRYFFTSVWRIGLYLIIVFGTLLFIVAIATNTY